MSEKYSFIVVTFPGRDTAIEAFNLVAEWEKEGKLTVADAVTVYKNKRGKIKLHKKSKLTGRKGAAIFGSAGLIIGAILGGPLLGALVGAVIGGTASGWTGLRRDVKKQLADELGPNESALCLLVKSANWAAVEAAMAEHEMGGFIMIAELTPDAMDALTKLALDVGVADAVAEEMEEESEEEMVADILNTLEAEANAAAIKNAEWAEKTTELADEAEQRSRDG